MFIGQRIKEERIKKGYSQEQLGNLIGVSKVSICGYEKGVRTPSLSIFNKLVSVLDLDPDYALGNDVNAIAEKGEKYTVNVAKEDLQIINILKKHPKLYNRLCSDPKRTIDLIARKMNL
jgi:transcriptional regulator with XRE-family HTH domain